ncbi:S1 family peptidase [Methanobacterium sp. MBAC-LM]|uniref:S1 family peptidase n=1 Tax=Methanobacterium sp. MBAC-LM TaxID=3412034 RepID=UPI003C72DFAA
MLEKWKNAVVNLDCKNQNGTALFLIHKSKRYLLTAKHVVWDIELAEKNYNDEVWRSWSLPEPIRQDSLSYAGKKGLNEIFPKIFFVDQFGKKPSRHLLMNLHAGVLDLAPYTFDHESDLAIISLNQRNIRFADKLEMDYEPIPSSYILNEPSKEGADVFTVGYPVDVSEYKKMELSKATENWTSKFISIPTFTFGKVSQLKDNLNYFWIDMSICPGNSGGPVIENDKLVGIVVGQAGMHDEDLNVEIRIPFGSAIKSRCIWKLIEQQEKKDNVVNKRRS